MEKFAVSHPYLVTIKNLSSDMIQDVYHVNVWI